MTSRIETFFAKISQHKYKTAIVALLLCMGIASGVSNIAFKNNYRIFFNKSNPDLQAFEKFQQVYTKTDNLVIIVHNKDGIFNANTVSLIKEITENSWQLPFSTRVDSVTNYQYSYSEEDDLIVEDLVEEDPFEMSAEDLARKKEIALKEEIIVDRILSPDATTTGILVTFSMDDEDPTAVQKIMKDAREMVANLEYDKSQIEIRMSGIVAMNNSFTEMAMKDGATIIPIMFLFIVITMIVVTRTLSGAFATTIISLLSIICALGIAGLVGINLSPPSASAPNVILTVAIADCMHIVIVMITYMKKGMSKIEAIRASMKTNFLPIFLTSLTTAIGFFSLNLAEVPPFRDLGNIVGFGVVMAFLLSTTLLPALLAILPIRVKKTQVAKSVSPFSAKIGNFVTINKKFIIVKSVAILLIAGFLTMQIDLNDEFVKYFGKSVEFRQDTDFMTENLTGIYQAEYSVESLGAEGVSAPEYLANLEKFEEWLRDQPEIFQTNSIIMIMKRLNKNMHGDNESYYKIPQDKNLASQYLLLYEMSLPYGLDLTDRININKSSSRLSLIFKEISTKDMRAFFARAQDWQMKNLPEYMVSKPTGPNVMFAYISDRNIKGMIKSSAVATLIVSLIISIAFKSVRIGLISLIPNIAPIILAMGVWSLLVGQVNMAISTIFTMVFGIVVDDTIHIMSKFYYARRTLGKNIHDSIQYTFEIAGKAILGTTIVLVVGFGILGMSTFVINKNMGILAAISIFMAFFFDIFVLPALLSLGRKDTSPHKINNS